MGALRAAGRLVRFNPGMTLRLASFGVRGFVGQSLTPRVVMDFASAFGSFVEGQRVLLGRDTRYSSPMIHAAVTASLMGCGCEILDFGICPTPVLQFAVRRRGAAGAVSISGGHNGMGWNAMTLLGQDGAFLEPGGGETVLDRFHAGDFRKCDAQHLGAVETVSGYFDEYVQALSRVVDMEAIRRSNFTVLIDPVGGAGCLFLEDFARALGFRLVDINGQPSGYLAREPEPRPRSALQMASFIRHVQGHIGFVLSSDLGRLSLVTEAGEPASEEYTFPMVARHLLNKRPGTVVTNCCTSRMVDDLARRHGVVVEKTPVGQAYVMARLADEQGRVGGEGSGSAALPEFSPAFDGFLMMALILESLAETGARASELVRSLPRYHMIKRRVVCSSRQAYRALEAFRGQASSLKPRAIELTDGVRLDWEDGWLHARASHTEQMIRVITEAVSKEVAGQRSEAAMRLIGQVT